MVGCCLLSARAVVLMPPERTISRKSLTRFQSRFLAKSWPFFDMRNRSAMNIAPRQVRGAAYPVAPWFQVEPIGRFVQRGSLGSVFPIYQAHLRDVAAVNGFVGFEIGDRAIGERLSDEGGEGKPCEVLVLGNA